jgi:hypothetical protein
MGPVSKTDPDRAPAGTKQPHTNDGNDREMNRQCVNVYDMSKSFLRRALVCSFALQDMSKSALKSASGRPAADFDAFPLEFGQNYWNSAKTYPKTGFLIKPCFRMGPVSITDPDRAPAGPKQPHTDDGNDKEIKRQCVNVYDMSKSFYVVHSCLLLPYKTCQNQL